MSVLCLYSQPGTGALNALIAVVTSSLPRRLYNSFSSLASLISPGLMTTAQGMSEAIEKLRNWKPNQPPLKWCDLKKAVEEYDKLIEDYERIEWKYNEILEVFINEIHQIREMLAPAVTPE